MSKKTIFTFGGTTTRGAPLYDVVEGVGVPRNQKQTHSQDPLYDEVEFNEAREVGDMAQRMKQAVQEGRRKIAGVTTDYTVVDDMTSDLEVESYSESDVDFSDSEDEDERSYVNIGGVTTDSSVTDGYIATNSSGRLNTNFDRLKEDLENRIKRDLGADGSGVNGRAYKKAGLTALTGDLNQVELGQSDSSQFTRSDSGQSTDSESNARVGGKEGFARGGGARIRRARRRGGFKKSSVSSVVSNSDFRDSGGDNSSTSSRGLESTSGEDIAQELPVAARRSPVSRSVAVPRSQSFGPVAAPRQSSRPVESLDFGDLTFWNDENNPRPKDNDYLVPSPAPESNYEEVNYHHMDGANFAPDPKTPPLLPKRFDLSEARDMIEQETRRWNANGKAEENDPLSLAGDSDRASLVAGNKWSAANKKRSSLPNPQGESSVAPVPADRPALPKKNEKPALQPTPAPRVASSVSMTNEGDRNRW